MNSSNYAANGSFVLARAGGNSLGDALRANTVPSGELMPQDGFTDLPFATSQSSYTHQNQPEMPSRLHAPVDNRIVGGSLAALVALGMWAASPLVGNSEASATVNPVYPAVSSPSGSTVMSHYDEGLAFGDQGPLTYGNNSTQFDF